MEFQEDSTQSMASSKNPILSTQSVSRRWIPASIRLMAKVQIRGLTGVAKRIPVIRAVLHVAFGAPRYDPTRASSRQSVGDAGRKLERIFLKAGRRVVQERVRASHRQAEAL